MSPRTRYLDPACRGAASAAPIGSIRRRDAARRAPGEARGLRIAIPPEVRLVPYVECPNCRLTVYTAASWRHIDECPRCFTQLRGPGRLFRRILQLRGRAGVDRP